MSCVLGVFVGGKGRRMGGVQKALLRVPDSDETLVARLVRIGREAQLEVVLIGEAELGAVARDVQRLRDCKADSGPLAGLVSLLEYAAERPAIALACDMPFIRTQLVMRLRDELPAAPVLAARDLDTGKWNGLCARYASAAIAPLAREAFCSGARSFQALLSRCDTRELALSSAERAELRDWDTKEDMRSSC